MNEEKKVVEIKSKKWQYALLAVGITIIFILMYRIGFNEIAESLSHANLKYILIAAGFIGIVVALKGIRWQLLFNKLNFLSSLKIYFIGQAVNEIAPTGSGELTKIFIAKKRYGIPKRFTLVSAVMVRLCDIIYLIVIASFGVFFIQGVSVTKIIIPLVLIVLFSIIILKPQIIKYFRAFLHAANKKILLKLSAYLKDFQIALFRYHTENKSALAIGLVLTVGAWIADGFSHLFILKAFGQSISYFNLLIVIAVAWFLGIFSFLPGGLGVREGIYVYLLDLQGIGPSIGLAIILVQRFLLYSYFFPTGLASVISYKNKRGKS